MGPTGYSTAASHSISRLPDDVLQLILDQLEPDPDRTVAIDGRQFLSVESFDRTPLSTRGSTKDIGAWRCACKRFAELGAPLLFSRVAVRFSEKGLARLDAFADWPHLTRHVKKFSYLVPYFFKSGDSAVAPTVLRGFQEVAGGPWARLELPGTRDVFIKLNLEHLVRKAQEQQRIINSAEDLRVLKRAIATFTSLQFVQLLRVTDHEEAGLLNQLRNHEALRRAFDLDWTPACSHSSHTIGQALLAANVPWSRFSSPMLSPQSAEFLAYNRPNSLSTLAARLTCLTLHFDDGSDLDQKMSELSGLFRTVFTTAKSMQAVHVGFPSHRPLSLPLEDVFHHVKWDKLVAFGIQGWRLDGAEILGLALRHRDRLKGLRLRDVLLKEGSTWREVLVELRSTMRRLEWVSLRRIGYARVFDQLWEQGGFEVPDDAPPGESDSDSDSDADEDVVNHDGDSNEDTSSTRQDHSNDAQFENDENDDSYSYDGSDFPSDSDSEHGRDAHTMDFPPLDSPSTLASLPWCSCSGRSQADYMDDLDDDGEAISNTKRKRWEKWVVRRCPEHGSR